MYFITKEKGLIGKTIAYTHMAQFAEKAVIGTTDGGLFVLDPEIGEDDVELHIANEYLIMNHIFKSSANKFMVEELVKAGVITANEFDEYMSKRKLAEELRRSEWAKEQEKKDYENYLRLKVKYEQPEDNTGNGAV